MGSWEKEFQRCVQEVGLAVDSSRRPSVRAAITGTLNTNVLKAFGNGGIDLDQFVSGGGVTSLVNCLKIFKETDRVVEAVARAFELYVVRGGKEYQKTILKSNAIPNLVATISKTQSTSAAEVVVRVLYIYTPTTAALEHMISSDIVEKLCSLISVHSNSVNLLTTSIQVLTNVCVGREDLKVSFKNHGGIAAVAKAMEANEVQLSINESAAILLRTVGSDSEEIQDEIARLATAPLMNVLKRFVNNRTTAHQACNALTNVTSTNLKNRDLVLASDGAKVLVPLLQRWMDDKEIAADALALIRNTVVGKIDSARRLADQSEDFIGTVCQAMLKNEESHEVQLRASQVLRYACFAEENRQRVRDARGISAIAGAILYANNFKTTGEEFYVNVILALGNACFNASENKNSAGKSGALSEAIKLLFNHRDLLAVQEAGLRLLRCLTEDNEFNARLAASEKALNLCTMDLVGHADNADVCENGLALLLNLCFSREMLEKMLEGDVENIVVTTLERHPRNRIVQIQGQRILIVLQTEPENVTDNPSQIANRYEDYIDEVVLPTRSSGSLRRALCG